MLNKHYRISYVPQTMIGKTPTIAAVQPSERLASLSIMGAEIRAPLKPLKYYGLMV